MDKKFKEHLIKILKATGYGLEVTPDDLDVPGDSASLNQFYEWFITNITKENCLTPNELSDFRKLEENNKVLYGEELDKALEARMSTSGGPLVSTTTSMLEATLEAKKSELALLQEQFEVKTQLLSSTNASIAAVDKDIKQLSQKLKEADETNTVTAANVIGFNRLFNDKLDEIQQTLQAGRQKYSVLLQTSTDEAGDSHASDHLDASFMSTASGSSVASSAPVDETNQNAKFLCQMNFDKYLKHDRRFNKFVEKLVHHKKELKAEKDNGREVHLEFMNIWDRLSIQKKSLIMNAAEIEGLKAGQQKIDEITHEIKNGRLKELLAKIKNEASTSSDGLGRDNSFSQIDEDLDASCKLWGEGHILTPVSEVQQQNLEKYKQLINQLDEIIKDLKLKFATDRVFSELLHFEVEKVEQFFDLHKKVNSMIRKLEEDYKERMGFMQENLQDYREYQSLPLEDRYEPIGWLAQMLGVEKKDLAQAVDDLDKNVDSKRKEVLDHYEQNLQGFQEELQRQEHQLAALLQSSSINQSQTAEDASLDLYQTVRGRLDQMNDLIEETNLQLVPNQGPMVHQEEYSEVEKLLEEKMSQLKKE